MKTLLFVLLVLAAPAWAEDTRLNMPPDGWGGARAHLTYSAGMSLVGSEVLNSRWKGGAACFAVGVLKEWSDYRKETPGYRHGLFSRNDLKMDALGCAIGSLANWGLHVAFEPAGRTTIALNWRLP